MKVLFITPYPHTSADTRYRLEQFQPGLRRAGIEAEVRPFMSERLFKIYHRPGAVFEKASELAAAFLRRAVDVLQSRRYDVVVIHKEAFAFGPPVAERLLRRFSGAVVFDLDDAFWTHPRQLNQIGRRLRDPNKTVKLFQLSDHIIAGNEYIARYARHYNSRVTVIPTVIDTHRYQPRPAGNTDQVVIGWVGRWSSAFYLNRLVPVFQQICRRYPQVQIRLVGAPPQHWPEVRAEFRPWRLDSEVEDLQAFDVGLMPLEADEYAHYKCGFKMLQYMGVAVPVVVSPVGVNKDIVRDGENGYLADSADEWLSKLSTLIEDKGLRSELGAAGRRTVQEEYSLERALPLMESVLRESARHGARL